MTADVPPFESLSTGSGIPRSSMSARVEVFKGAAGEVESLCKQVVEGIGPGARGYDPRWMGVVCRGLSHAPYLLVASRDDRPVGVLPLAFVKSALFGRFLVSLPYVNTAGVLADNDETATALIDSAVTLADQLRVRHLELRHESAVVHPALSDCLTSKVHMRLALPDSVDKSWQQLHSKKKNQVRKGEKQGFTVHWGGEELLDSFYDVFSQNMRDLGTPVFSRRLFTEILSGFPETAEFCVIRSGKQPIAAALLVHGDGVTQVPSASSLRSHNSTNANDWMYWQLLQRAIARGQRVFDFGRSSVDSKTYDFKKKWGGVPEPAVWQYYIRAGRASDMRPDSGKYDRLIAVWQRLPVWLTRWIGPPIVRGIP